ncbi:MAG: ATP-dependent zinc metalloprotease FtsH [Clostridium sp.]|nr:ATP-dependent zinc metalloprotease FtsH [Clostridium sp.]MDY5896273.1 ATP-dependent zinc metalloprotease FtsH [Oscillospiraceae bacterium]
MLLAGLSYYISAQSRDKLEYYQLVALFDEGKVTEYKLNLSSGALVYKTVGDDTEKTFTVPSVNLFVDDIHEGVIKYNREHPDSMIKAGYITGSTGQWIYNIVPTLLLLAAMGGLTFFMFRRMNQTMTNETNRTMSFGKARVKQVKDEKRKTTFDDVAGADEEKEELAEIVEFLKNPARFDALGARIPKGVLLVGPPGTGKTLLARAVAGEANVPFFSISGSDFVEMYVGVGASRVRDLFDQAKKNSPSIIFIDEIDAVGRHRGAGMGGGHDEREQTLNQLLVEMDGFGANEGVIVIAATNRPDILDPALLRPGRFDRQVTVNYPDTKGRVAILKVHAKGKPIAPDVDFESIAHATVGFTGADLENLLNEAALLAARTGKKAITMAEIDEAALKVEVGSEKKSHKMNEKAKRLTAYHEAGHAVSNFYLDHVDPVHQISIIPRGMAGGYTLHRPTEDKNYTSKNEMLDSLVGLLGGRVAEALVIGDVSTGASNDIERATEIARSMVTKYGMSDKLGPIAFGDQSNEVFLGKDFNHVRNYSESVASQIDEEIERIVKDAYSRTKEILSEHIDKLHAVAQALLKEEKIDGKEFEAIMKGEQQPAEAEPHPETAPEAAE